MTSKLFLCLSLLAASTVQAHDYAISSVQISGNGCPQGSPNQATLLQEGTMLSLSQPPLDLASQSGSLRRLQCTTMTVIKSIPNMQVRVVGYSTMISDASSQAGDTATISSYLQGSAKTAQAVRPLVNGPLVGDLDGEWSACGKEVVLVNKFALQGSQNGTLSGVRGIRLVWQGCP